MDVPSPPRYLEHGPSPELAPWVECFWTLEGARPPGSGAPRPVLPDGCMDVILDLAPDPLLPGLTAYVVGTMTRPIALPPRARVDALGVRFRPGAAPAFLDLRADALVDGRAPLHAFWGAGAEEARERAGEGGPAAVDDLLLGRLGQRSRDDAPVRLAARLLGRAEAAASVLEVAAAVGLGRRQLERRFRASVGVSPCTLARILRFRRAVRELGRPRSASLARIATLAGYHDQPHMNRDFRELAGTTPGGYRRSLGLPLHDASVQDRERSRC